ncbi:MAG: hypothetical protein IKR80_00655, partial [Spirochaetales bacterium]|nr:hypothetical protein [Spirochaetales bacterium]
MSNIEKLLSSESFDAMVVSVCFWVILYVIVKVITIHAGVGNLLKHADSRIVKLRKDVVRLKMLCTPANAASRLSKSVKVLDEIIKAEKRATKVLTMYLFDDRNDFDVAQARSIVRGIPDGCREALVKVAEKEDDDI